MADIDGFFEVASEANAIVQLSRNLNIMDGFGDQIDNVLSTISYFAQLANERSLKLQVPTSFLLGEHRERIKNALGEFKLL